MRSSNSAVGLGAPIQDFERARARAAARRALFGIEEAPIERIGRYRIVRRLGKGGMGEVYLGIDDELERLVAVKLVLPHLGGRRGHARLRREARALARLSHPNVVRVYEVGQHQGRTFLAMEYVEGGTLATWLGVEARRGASVLERFLAAGRGLAAAHAAGITHRDFKPDNVLMLGPDQVCVADFGLAYSERPPGSSPAAGASGAAASGSRLSEVGAVLGTTRYMPLEQLRGDDVDARADQFAFCVALYEALWGDPPFPMGDLFERLEALERAEPRPPPRGAPRRLWRAIRRGLARDPRDRWPDMETLLVALEPAPSRGRWRLVAVALVGFAVGLVGLGWARESPPPRGGTVPESATNTVCWSPQDPRWRRR